MQAEEAASFRELSASKENHLHPCSGRLAAWFKKWIKKKKILLLFSLLGAIASGKVKGNRVEAMLPKQCGCRGAVMRFKVGLLTQISFKSVLN